MYNKRINIFLILCSCLLLICLIRLAQLQLTGNSAVRQRIAELKLQYGRSQPLNTVRGKILDRKGRCIAKDEPEFQLCINYGLTSFADERVQRGKLLKIKAGTDDDLARLTQELDGGLADLETVINKCVQFGVERKTVEKRIEKINERIWRVRSFLAWRRYYLDDSILKKYDNKITNIPLSIAMTDFREKEPNEDKRLLGTIKIIDIEEINRFKPLMVLTTDDDIFTAQIEFAGMEGIKIMPKSVRVYPYKSVAAQTIGWVSPAAQEKDRELFKGDKFLSYQEGEVCGKEDGVEYICESVLRGKRGEVFYDIDGQSKRTENEFGCNVTLALDIELQERIENYLINYKHLPGCGPGMAAVVIEVGSGDILSLVSLPTFDLNRVRQDYGKLIAHSDKPMINRAINKQYPPGSAVKPLILVAGLETGNINAGDIINCSAQRPPKAWPRCWIQKKYPWKGHSDDWSNNARNAIKGSCNIYFSRLAERIESRILQKWLYGFGYGRRILFPPAALDKTTHSRNFRQLTGQISDVVGVQKVLDFNDIKPLSRKSERRWFGIGQGNLRVTPLQVANAVAVIARGGLYKKPQLFIEESQAKANSFSLDISKKTLSVVRDGMYAVVNEINGTAYKEFRKVDFGEYGVKVYGKTGSTEAPENAWFTGFAEDQNKRCIVVAVVVEGGKHGSSDATPLARDMISFCVETGYLRQNEALTK